ncbi:MAG: chemotaxis-specific protein-glutamate methyltransferase CheB [Planctomycetota bacterium]|nr:chemotaxis-specific protein-glutamate methyltransferase CheB [Planctomycetota bacterium]
MPRTRVLAVEDSLTVRKRILEVLASDPTLEVVGEAEDGKRAIELCQALRPDVITMDMMLPVMTGLAATEYIMAYCPTPILVVSASVNRGELFRTYDALAAGAVDVLEKPTGDEPEGQWEAKFLAAVKMVARIKVITHPRRRLNPSTLAVPLPVRGTAPARAEEGGPRLIAIGTSTGGPAALRQMLMQFPPDLSVPVLMVIHIGKIFAGPFAEWLSGQSDFRVAYAADRTPLPPLGAPCVLLAPPDQHLVVKDGLLRLNQDPERHSCRPSVDVLFESIARECGSRAIACLLTGMGKDGAEGLLAIRRAGGRTFAQDEASSVVYGMPREAALIGAAERVLPLDQIAPAVAALAGHPRRPA